MLITSCIILTISIFILDVKKSNREFRPTSEVKEPPMEPLALVVTARAPSSSLLGKVIVCIGSEQE